MAMLRSWSNVALVVISVILIWSFGEKVEPSEHTLEIMSISKVQIRFGGGCREIYLSNEISSRVSIPPKKD